jgi:hypothetical protein
MKASKKAAMKGYNGTKGVMPRPGKPTIKAHAVKAVTKKGGKKK